MGVRIGIHRFQGSESQSQNRDYECFVFGIEGGGDGANFSAYLKKKGLGPTSILGEHIDSIGVGNEGPYYGTTLYLCIVGIR